MKRWLSFSKAQVIFLAPAARGAITIRWGNGPGTEVYYSDGTTPLSAGTNLSRDGTLIELGYYDAATVGASFVGTWVPLTGSLTGPANPGTMGDFGALPHGRFALASTFEVDQLDAPAIGTPLSVRFYDGYTIATSGHYNSASTSDAKFRWPSTPNGLLLFNLDDPTVVWKGGPETAFRTSLPIPEGTTLMILLFGCVLLGRRSRMLQDRLRANHQ